MRNVAIYALNFVYIFMHFEVVIPIRGDTFFGKKWVVTYGGRNGISSEGEIVRKAGVL